MNGIDILNEIAKIRGIGPELIHKVIHKFDWFISSIIWGEDSKSEKVRAVHNWGKVQTFTFDEEKTLTMWILLFRKWYREVQEPTFKELDGWEFEKMKKILIKREEEKNNSDEKRDTYNKLL